MLLAIYYCITKLPQTVGFDLIPILAFWGNFCFATAVYTTPYPEIAKFDRNIDIIHNTIYVFHTIYLSIISVKLYDFDT